MQWIEIWRLKYHLKNVHFSSNSNNCWTQPNIAAKVAQCVAWIHPCKQYIFGEKNWLHFQRYWNFLRGLLFWRALYIQICLYHIVLVYRLFVDGISLPYTSNEVVIYMCRYYRKMYSCLNDWLHSRPNCSSEVTSVVLGANLRFTERFTSKYNCSIVRSTGTADPLCCFSVIKHHW